MENGRSSPAGSPALSLPEALALGLGAVWLLLCAVYFSLFRQGDGGLGFLLTLLVIFLPVAVIWVGVASARAARIMREEARRLHAAIDGMREVVLADRRERAAGGVKPEVEQKIDAIAQSARQTQTALATFSSARPAGVRVLPRPEMPPEDQPSLALGTQIEETAPPLANADLIRALNFPDSPEDKEGFAALRRALAHRGSAQLVQAAQDMLTLLSQDGIYMDDLRPDLARPEFWRRFAQGERGPEMAPLGGVRDRSSLALTAGRMREDAIFRDAAHHFLRRFDSLLFKAEPEMSDEELVALSDTRTARAFMLVGRVTGAFD